MTDFLHGVETFDNSVVPQAVRGVKTAVVGLVGTAPIQHVAAADRRLNLPVVLLSDVDDAKYFGPDLPGYTIPKALKIHRANGVGIIVVTNVFDPATHKATVAGADRAIVNGKVTLPNKDILTATVKAAGGAGAALVEGTDYTIDKVNGIVTTVASGALDGDANAHIAYDHGDPSDVVAADVIGEVDEGGARTGLLSFKDCMTKFGFYPKILECPVFSTEASVVTALDSMATTLRAVAWVDAPIGTTFSEALEGRGPDGEINLNASSTRLMLAFPHVKTYDPNTNDDVLTSLATMGAAVMAYVDQTEGFWCSPSNRVAKGITGIETPVTWAINDATTEANQLNAAGITTIANGFGTGYRIWGNRSSAFPASGDIRTFVSCLRTQDAIWDAIEFFMLPFIDKTISTAVIDAVLASTNEYMRTLANRGAVPPGSRVEFHKSKNPPTAIAAGQLTWSQVWAPMPPLERATFESVIDLTLLSNVLPQ